jgi:hypothetical protein
VATYNHDLVTKASVKTGSPCEGEDDINAGKELQFLYSLLFLKTIYLLEYVKNVYHYLSGKE